MQFKTVGKEEYTREQLPIIIAVLASFPKET
jgi:hypothetical protein